MFVRTTYPYFIHNTWRIRKNPPLPRKLRPQGPFSFVWRFHFDVFYDTFTTFHENIPVSALLEESCCPVNYREWPGSLGIKIPTIRTWRLAHLGLYYIFYFLDLLLHTLLIHVIVYLQCDCWVSLLLSEESKINKAQQKAVNNYIKITTTVLT